MQFVQVSTLSESVTENIAAIKNCKITGWKNVSSELIHSLLCKFWSFSKRISPKLFGIIPGSTFQ